MCHISFCYNFFTEFYRLILCNVFYFNDSMNFFHERHLFSSATIKQLSRLVDHSDGHNNRKQLQFRLSKLITKHFNHLLFLPFTIAQIIIGDDWIFLLEFFFFLIPVSCYVYIHGIGFDVLKFNGIYLILFILFPLMSLISFDPRCCFFQILLLPLVVLLCRRFEMNLYS